MFSHKLRKQKEQIKEHKYTIIIKWQIDGRGQYHGTVIEIKSMHLYNVLLDINKGVEDLGLSRREPKVRSLLPSPEHS